MVFACVLASVLKSHTHVSDETVPTDVRPVFVKQAVELTDRVRRVCVSDGERKKMVVLSLLCLTLRT